MAGCRILQEDILSVRVGCDCSVAAELSQISRDVGTGGIRDLERLREVVPEWIAPGDLAGAWKVADDIRRSGSATGTDQTARSERQFKGYVATIR